MSVGVISGIAITTLSDQEKKAFCVPLPSDLKKLKALTEPNGYERCKTCGGSYFSDVRSIKNKCKNHFSLIELPFFIPNHVHIKILRPFLNLLCPYCPFGIKIDYEKIKNYVPKDGINANINAISSYVYDDHVNHENTYFMPEKIKFEVGGDIDTMNYFIVKTTKKYSTSELKNVSAEDIELAGEEVYTILKNLPKYFYPIFGISQYTLSNLGDMITSSIVISPPYLRPQMADILSQYLSSYKKIILYNTELQNLINSKSTDVKAIYTLMSQIIAFHILISGDNGSKNKIAIKITNKENSNSMIPSYLEGLSGKKGNARKVTVNKRTDSGARVLLNGGCYLHGDLVQIPLKIAEVCCVNITVNKYNISDCRNLVLNGINGIYPGAYKIITNTNEEYLVKNNMNVLSQVQVGYIIQRQLMDGDVVITLRFPAHHENSFTAAFIRVTHEMSVRIPVCWNKKIGGDYDGDELNIMPLLYKSSAFEAMAMLSAAKQMMATSYSRLWVFADFDGDVDMLYNCTRVFVKRKWTLSEFMQCIGEISFDIVKRDVFDKFIEYCKNGTSFNIASLIIPEQINLRYASAVKKWFDKKKKILKEFPYIKDNRFQYLTHDYNFFSQDEDLDWNKNEYPYTIIHNGIIESGCIDEASFGITGILLISIINSYDSHTALDIYNALVVMSCAFNRTHSATLGIDYWIQDDIRKELDKVIDQRHKDFRLVYEQATSDKLQIPLGYTLKDFYELKVVSEIGSKYEDKMKNLLSSATSYRMMDDYFKFKDSSDLLVKSLGCVGQELLSGNERVQDDISWSRRSLACFPICSSQPQSYGHIDEHFIAGLGFNSYFITAIKGREELWNRGNKTADPGYFANRLEVLFESAIVDYDYTIVSNGFIMSSQYGSTSSDPRALFKHDLILGNISDKDFEEMYIIKDSSDVKEEYTKIRVENNKNVIIIIGELPSQSILDKFKNIDIYQTINTFESYIDKLLIESTLNMKYDCSYIVTKKTIDDLQQYLHLEDLSCSIQMNNKKLSDNYIKIDQAKNHYYITKKLKIENSIIIYPKIFNGLIYCL
jgi:DNA-directed RNA polymerase subunit A'